MNTQERTLLLNRFLGEIQKKITHLDLHDIKLQLDKPSSPLKNIQHKNVRQILTPPDTKILHEIITNQSQITTSISQTHNQINNVLQQINDLKNKKDNVQKLMDAMTAIMQIRKLSFGINSDDQETVYRNLTAYYQIKPKVYYCENQIQTIQEQISVISEKFKLKFNEQLLKTGNSQNISIVAKILQVINQHNKVGNQNFNLNNVNDTTKQLSKFYNKMLQKQLKYIEEQLFKIPIVGTNIQGTYIFFQLAKNSMKIVVNLVGTYRNNILKVVNFSGLSEVIIQIFSETLQTIIIQILHRQKKYFEVDKINIQTKKLSIKDKEYQRLVHYFNQFNAIWNQIQRLKIYLEEEILQEQYPEGWKDYINKLQNCTNSPKLLQFNQNAIIATKGCLRYQFDKILKKSPFITSLWNLESSFFKNYEVQLSSLKQIECIEGTDFLQQATSNFIKGIQKSFETLNTIFISSLINFTNHNLLYEDTFYTFNELLSRNINKLPTSDKKPFLAIILLLNTISHIPYHLKRFQQLSIPPDLNQERLKTEINELITTNSDKSHQFINQIIDRILDSAWIQQQLCKDYKKLIQKWSGLQRNVFQKLIKKISMIHNDLLLQNYFNPSVNSSKSINNKKYDLSTAMNIEKEIRNIINYYDSKNGVSVHQNFQLILGYSQVLLMETENQLIKFSQRFKDKFQLQDLKRVWNLRTK